MYNIVLLLIFSTYTYAGDVVQLTDNNFESTLADAEIALVKFYAPW